MNKRGQIGEVIRVIIIAVFAFLISEGFNEAFKSISLENPNAMINIAIFLTSFPIDLIVILAILGWYIYDKVRNN